MILGYCRFCHSSNTKISYAYPKDYYCVDCSQGGTLDSILSKKELEQTIEKKQIGKLKIDSNNPCCEVFLNEESHEAIWPQSDNGICDYD